MKIEPGKYQVDIVYYSLDGSLHVDHSWHEVEGYEDLQHRIKESRKWILHYRKAKEPIKITWKPYTDGEFA